jgi:hypothetical protein
VVVGKAYDDVIQYIETRVHNHECNPTTSPLPGHPIDNSIPTTPLTIGEKLTYLPLKLARSSKAGLLSLTIAKVPSMQRHPLPFG